MDTAVQYQLKFYPSKYQQIVHLDNLKQAKSGRWAQGQRMTSTCTLSWRVKPTNRRCNATRTGKGKKYTEVEITKSETGYGAKRQIWWRTPVHVPQLSSSLRSLQSLTRSQTYPGRIQRPLVRHRKPWVPLQATPGEERVWNIPDMTVLVILVARVLKRASQGERIWKRVWDTRIAQSTVTSKRLRKIAVKQWSQARFTYRTKA